LTIPERMMDLEKPIFNMTRPQLTNILAFVSALIFSIEVPAADDLPNIVFVFSDDHATQAISAYGGRLVERGIARKKKADEAAAKRKTPKYAENSDY
jgi:hypothetical protein